MIAAIFGAGGQLGLALSATKESGVEVHMFRHQDVDITSVADLSYAIEYARPDVIINAGAYSLVEEAESNPKKAFFINGSAPGLIARICKISGIRMVQMSTDYVFDGQSDRPYLPDDATNPLNVYGSSKLAGEQAVFSNLADAMVIRSAWLYGAGGNNFVITMLRLMRERDAINVVADQIGAPTHTESLARGIWKLVGSNARGILHYTDANETSWYGFAVAIEEEARAMNMIDGCEIVPITTDEYPAAVRRPLCSLLDCTLAYSITGPARHWRDELCKMLSQQKATICR